MQLILEFSVLYSVRQKQRSRGVLKKRTPLEEYAGNLQENAHAEV